MYTCEIMDLLQCILLRHCHIIKEMNFQKGLSNIEEDKQIIEFHIKQWSLFCIQLYRNSFDIVSYFFDFYDIRNF